jgi:pimeloyl-ACP methyl ester carboxylesterase
MFIKFLLALFLGFVLGTVYSFLKRPKEAKFIPFSAPKYVDLKDGRIHYIQEGQGEDVLLIHGIGSSHYAWRTTFERLKKKYRVTVIDLLGFGQSDKNTNAQYDLDSQTERVREILDKLNIQKVNVIGCSMGGLIALWLAKLDPNRVLKVLAISPAAHKNTIFINTNWLWPFVHLVKGFIVTPRLVRSLHARVVYNAQASPEHDIFQYYVPYHKNPDAVVCFWKSNDTLRDLRLPEELKNQQAPTLILYGERDKLVKFSHIQDLMRVLQRAKLITRPDRGHHLMVDDPDFVSSTASNFFGSTK